MRKSIFFEVALALLRPAIAVLTARVYSRKPKLVCGTRRPTVSVDTFTCLSELVPATIRPPLLRGMPPPATRQATRRRPSATRGAMVAQAAVGQVALLTETSTLILFQENAGQVIGGLTAWCRAGSAGLYLESCCS